ncbi:HDIG domain-containing protein [bacterium BMS3Abin03]|nr:HDIG domain-containing protein [bacterium BMS3Abin03]MCG6959605.1 HDIG domain-containing protein [bacterium BMS3Abin03]
MASEPNKTSVKTTIFRIIIALTTVALIALMFPKGESIESEVTEGSIWLKDDLIAPFSFPIIKSPDVYRRQIAAAERTVYPVFIEKNEIENISIDSLQVYNTYLTDIIDQNISSDSVETINPTFLSTATFKKFQSLRTRERNLIDVKGPKLKELFAAARFVLTKIYKAGILNIDSGKESKDSIAVRVGNVDRIKAISDFMFINNARDEVAKEVGRLQYPNDVGSALAEYTSHFVFPNLIYSSDLTDEEKEQARDNVSKYSGIVNENERIVAKHDRITKEIKLKIDSFKEAKGDTIGDEGLLLQYLGKFIHIGLLLLLLSIYLYLFRKKIFYDNNKLILIAIIFTFVTFVTFLINQIKVEAPVQLLIFIPAASMLFTIIFDSRVGFYTTIILALITGALRGNDYSFTTINLIAGGLSVYTVRDIKNRSQIFRSFLVILAGYFVSIIAFGLERFAPIETMLVELAFAASNALISPVLTYGLLIFFEKLFRITTDLTLLELSNFDRPLLKDLARKAPGTFNHSMTMGTMAEAAAETISANPLLARVGAYYHDIGKTITPQNYVENQLNNQNVHENLTPEESASLIASHVREGVQLAQDNDLPQEIIDFIPMHHGTTTMTYFYERAKKLYGENKVDINQYRYPGPKPQTKETAIVMLADGCESAVRSIEDADSKKVENVIDGILNARISDGQLNEAPITFSDIAKLKETFLGILLGQRHKRIRYPKQEEIEKGENKAEEK